MPVLCLTNVPIVTHFDGLVEGIILVFLNPSAVTKFQREVPHRDDKYTGWKKLRLSTEIAVYLANGTK